MPISLEFINIIEDISNVVDLPLIKEIVTPQNRENAKKSNFSAIILEDNSVGLIYINLSSKIKNKFKNEEFTYLKGSEPLSIIKFFNSKDLFERSLSLGVINAVSQFIFKKTNFLFDFTSDSLGLLDIKSSDIIGMVGFFPPLVKLIEKIGSKLIVIEKKEELVQKSKDWLVTLNPSKLKDCNKILITGTTVLNDTLDEVLDYCTSAEKKSVIGPTTSFLPDPLFRRGIDVIGGTYVSKSDLLAQAIHQSIRWSDSVKKYTIERKNYSSYKKLISKFST
ncbi:MAG: hypothetical protein EAX89_13850 [Candidatus Lokiarchaeota archaeon]|nr:hypothetical protein [Candidatus Lokiarchaeota archaeon]